VGIDYSIHVTQRFREELGRYISPAAALRATAQGTGTALLGSAASSVLGFAVMSLAPMPLFSAYGILTAMMILMASGAALLVLPSLLMLVAPIKVE
jgi:predicted RND superfamily exporter protein